MEVTKDASSDAHLVAEAAKGSTAAFDVLICRHYDTVFAVAFARLRDRDAAEDMAQEVFLRAWLSVGQLRDGSRFQAWTVRMARNLSANWHRSGTRRSRLVRMVPMDAAQEDERLADERPNAREAAVAEERLRAVHDALDRLDPRERELVVLHYMDNASHREIAARLGVNHTTIGRRLEKALAGMRGMLADGEVAVRPRPAARAAATAMVLAAAAMPVQTQAALSTAAAASAPASGKIAAAGELLQTLATVLLEGVKAMSAANKIGIAAVAVACFGGGTVLLVRDPAPSPASQSAGGNGSSIIPDPPVSGSAVYRSGTEATFNVRNGERVALTLPDPLMEIARATLFAPGDGTLVVESTRTDGSRHRDVFPPTIVGAAALDENVTVQIWEERSLFVVSVIFVRRTTDGMSLSLFTANRPELLPQAKSAERSFNEGRASKQQLRSGLVDFLGRNDMLPRDPELRSAATTWILARLY